MPLEQRREHARRVDAANFANFQRRDRLLVGDDGERFEPLHGQLLRRALVEEPPHPFVQLGARHDLIAARNLHELQPRTRLVVRPKGLDCRRHIFLRLVGEEPEQHLRRQRFRRREDQRLDDRFQ
jgi:hypothetical protein